MQYNEHVRTHFAKAMKPKVAELLALLNLDKVYTSAQGAYLTYTEGETTHQVLDCIGGYGAALLGHNHPVIRAEIARIWQANEPDNVQLSVPKSAVELATWLSDEMFDLLNERYVATFANSGAEVVEAAVKHANLLFHDKMEQFWKLFDLYSVRLLTEAATLGIETAPIQDELGALKAQNEAIVGQPIVISARNGYHGKTSAALKLTFNAKFRKPFGVVENVFFEPTDASLEFFLSEQQFELRLPRLSDNNTISSLPKVFNRVSMVIIEPIQGEGGVRKIADETLQKIAKTCAVFGVSLAFDEIQSGSYRVNGLLSSGRADVRADYYLLGKALGGGQAKIGACMVRESLLHHNFGVLHTSTFAESGHSGAISLAAIRYTKQVEGRVANVGRQLTQMLSGIARAYPKSVLEVRGEGLLFAIEFRRFRESGSYGLQILDRSGYLHYIMAGYLLNIWKVRVSAPLSASNTLRIQPPYCITTNDVEQLRLGLIHLCEIMEHEDLYKLIEYSLPKESQGLRDAPMDFRNPDFQRVTCPNGATKIGFITHFIDASGICGADPSLFGVNPRDLEDFLAGLLAVSVPFMIGSVVIEGKNKHKTHLSVIGLAITSGIARRAMLAGDFSELTELCHTAIDVLADEEGVKLVGLGQFSSILTKNATTHRRTDVGVTTGNTYTTYLGIEAILKHLKLLKRPLEQEVLGVIGAAGNIASIYAQSLARSVGKVVLIGSTTSAIRRARGCSRRRRAPPPGCGF